MDNNQFNRPDFSTKPVTESNESKGKAMKKSYLWFALSTVVFGVVATVIQVLCTRFLVPKLGIDPDNGWYSFVLVLVSIHIIAFAVMLLLTAKQDKMPPEKHNLSLGRLLLCIPLMAALIGVGAVVGFIINAVITLPFGVPLDQNTGIIQMMTGSNPFWRILVAGITAPIVEEMVFRKLLIDRVVKYGEWVAILTSGIMFGLFHGNFSQFFFATLLGGFFAYIYVRTGKIWYTMFLHATVNLTTSVITMALIEPYMDVVNSGMMQEYEDLVNRYAATGGTDKVLEQQAFSLAGEMFSMMGPFMLWSSILGQIAFAGIVLWIIFLAKKKFHLKSAPMQVQGGLKYAWINVGMIVFLIYTICEFVLNYISVISSVSVT